MALEVAKGQFIRCGLLKRDHEGSVSHPLNLCEGILEGELCWLETLEADPALLGGAGQGINKDRIQGICH